MRTFVLLSAVILIIFTGCLPGEDPFPEPTPEVTPEPAIFWAKTYGGTGDDTAYDITETGDNGYLVFAQSNSFDNRSYDLFTLKMDSTGELSWSRTFGGDNGEYVSSGIETSDNGFIIAGDTHSFGAGDYDAWFLKRANNGMIQWQKRFGIIGTSDEYFTDIIETNDNKYILVGYCTLSDDNKNIVVMKFDENGDIVWQKGFGGDGEDRADSVIQTADNGYILVGYTFSFGQGNSDGWIIKINSIGNLEWQKVIGSSGTDRISAIQQTTDQGYIMAGHYEPNLAGVSDLWVIKMNNDGDIEWQYSFGGAGHEWAESVLEKPDGGYIVCGNTNSAGNGDYDFWISKLTHDGTVEWQKTYGGIAADEAKSLQLTADGGYIAAGYTISYGAGSNDIWVIKLNEDGECPPLDSDSSLARSVPSPVITIPEECELTTSLGGVNTTCIVNENPGVTVIQLVP